MHMRRGLGWAWGLVTVLIAGLAAWFAYNAGLAVSFAHSAGDGVAVVPRYYDGGFGFGFVPFLLFILLLFVIFRRRRWYGGYGRWGHGPWGGHRAWGGYGPGHDQSGQGQQPGKGPGHDVPPFIEERLKSWHEQAHGTTPAEPGAGSADPPRSEG